MKKLLLALLVLAPVVAIAAKTQIAGTWKSAGSGIAVAGRSDGVFLEPTTHAPYVVENGTPALPIGFGYLESFTPSDYAAVPSALLTLAGLVQSASAQQLDIGYFGPHAFIFAQSTAQTILPVTDAIGLDIAGDLVSAEAYEMFAGILGASGRPAVVGKDPAFYFCATFEVADASSVSDLHVGWRSATETQVKLITSYSNYATIGLEGTANPNTIYTMTGNDGTDANTDTTLTWADAASKKLCAFVSATGAFSASVNGTTVTTAAFSFDDGDSLIPFVAVEQGAGVGAGDAVDLTEWAVGYTE